MKKYFWPLFIISATALSMENSNEIFVDESDQEATQEIASPSPPGTLPNFEAYSLIECLKPGEVLLSKVTEAGLNASNLFKDFLVVSYQSGRYQDAFYFVPEKMAKEAEKALSLYSETKPGFYAYLIPIKDDGKFLELAAKTSAGCAEKAGSWTNDVSWKNNFEEIFSWEFSDMLSRQLIARAVVAPSQSDDQKNGDWSCGPNSGYRALLLCNEPGQDYDSFLKDCPRSISRPDMIGGGVAAIGGMSALSFLFPLAAFPLYISSMAASAAAGIGAAMPSDVGPGPVELARYLNSKITRGEAKFSGYHSHWDCLIDIHKGIIDLRRPTIVLLISSTFSMHYVVVIGLKDGPSGAVILDTNGRIGVILLDRLRYWMNRDGYANGLLPAKYNAILFTPGQAMMGE